MNLNFTFKNYIELLDYFGKTHKYITFSDCKNKSYKDSIILLRHDIDFSLLHALKMATIEADMGIRSTYFILFSSPFYNIFDVAIIKSINMIKELGHEIGLHYDTNAIEKGNSKSPISLLNSQVNILSELCGYPVASICMHNPSISGIDIFRKANYINAYDDEFTKEMAYFSDSCMAWRNSFVDHVNFNNFPSKIQLLIHPILWSEQEITRWEKLEQFILIKVKEIQNTGENIKEIWENHSGVIEHDLRIMRQANKL